MIRTCFIYSFVFLVAVLSRFSLSAQTNSLNEMLTDYASYNQSHLREKIYVHTDRSYYLCGEILWFKTYLVNAADNYPLSVSKVVYVEVLNKSHQPVLQAKITIKEGTGSGSFDLPLTLSSGIYELRAYTNWMKNDSSGYFFRKIITIVNTTQNLDASVRNAHTSYFANFFPEGGHLVNGVASVVGFKINDNKGNGLDGTGVVVDQAKDTVAQFKTTRFGMGNFSFIPKSGNHYTAVIVLNDSSVISKDVPDAFDKGLVMHLTEEGNQLNVAVASANEPSQQLYVLALNKEQITFAATKSLSNNSAVFNINKDSLKEGMTRITVFNEKKEPVCERLYFKRPTGEMRINARADKTDYGNRQKVNINVSTLDPAGDSLKGNLSLAVYRLDSLHQPSQDNIFTYLWLSSYLKGYIENASYYFKNDNEETKEALDNLLLTQGWSSYDWNDTFESTTPSFTYVPENAGHIITGRVTDEITGKPAANVLVYLSVLGRRVQLHGCISDEKGLVHFDLEDFYGKNQVILQTNTSKDSIYRFEIFSPFSEEFSDDLLPALAVPENNADALEQANLSMKVQAAYHEADLKKLQQPDIDSLPFYGKPTKTYLLDNYTRFTTMEEVMREYVAEVNVAKKGKDYHFYTFSAPAYALKEMQFSEVLLKDNPLMLLDGVPVFDVNKIIAYDPLKVQKLEVVGALYKWGAITANGILSYTTYKGDLYGYTLNPHDLLVDYDGLQKQRIFYAPEYATEKERENRLPDFRTLLYWTPDIITDKKGNAQISFYTGDIPGKYIVELQGISANGDAGSSEFILNVAK